MQTVKSCVLLKIDVSACPCRHEYKGVCVWNTEYAADAWFALRLTCLRLRKFCLFLVTIRISLSVYITCPLLLYALDISLWLQSMLNRARSEM